MSLNCAKKISYIIKRQIYESSMINYKGMLRDVHGVTYHNPVILINNINFRSNHSVDCYLSDVKQSTDRHVKTSIDCNVSFSALIYVSDVAYKDGFDPLPFRDLNKVEWFRIDLDYLPIDTSDSALCKLVEDWLMDNVLPTMEIKK